MQNDSPARARLRAKRAGVYQPEHLADAILALLEYMECVSDMPTPASKYRCRTGLYNAALYRGAASTGQTEDAITGWLGEFFSNAECQVTDHVAGVRPDIAFAYERDALGEDVLVVLEAKPVWQRWISGGIKHYAGETIDEVGRATGTYCNNGIRQVVGDRDKLLSYYTDSRDRHMLLALVFQRPDEVDSIVSSSIGPGWKMRKRHVVDRCNPPGDNIGLTGMIFWPVQQSATTLPSNQP